MKYLISLLGLGVPISLYVKKLHFIKPSKMMVFYHRSLCLIFVHRRNKMASLNILGAIKWLLLLNT